MEDLFKKFRKQFIEEIFALVDQLESDLLVLENDPNNRVVIDSIFRAMHTIKGTSGMYGFTFVSEFTHHLESIYQSIRDTEAEANKVIIDISFASLDHIKHLIDDEQLQNVDNKNNHEQLLNRIKAYVDNEGVVSDSKEIPISETEDKIKVKTWSILIRTDEQLFFRGINFVNLLTDLSSLGTFHIHRISSLSDFDTETWGVVLISDATINDIKDVFMFIEDNCTFTLVKEGDLLDQELQGHFVKVANDVSLKSLEHGLPRYLDEDLQKKESATIPTATTQTKYNIKRINVDAAKLDYLMYLVSELITLNSLFLQTTKDDYYEAIRPQIEQMESLVKLFRNNALEIRLVPLNDLILKFQRLVRDLSKQLGKKIEFVTQGTDIELDKNTIDLIADPIIHIIRNCIDHGIETTDERIKKGKPDFGTIKLSASHVGNYIHLKIEDDGKGLDLNKIKENAIKRGIIKSADELTKRELTDLIFTSGVSTAKSVTSVSGRGVGMDVVKRTINELRGEITVETEENKGTAFTLKIQQSVAIVDTLLFRVENTYFIVPLTEIEICLRLTLDVLIKNQNTGTIEYNEQMIPYVDLRSLFNLQGNYQSIIKILIIKNSDRYLAILCDEIVGEQQAVLKPLGQAFTADNGILAAAQQGSGKWAYLLNIHFLFEKLKSDVLSAMV
jgi:two-component system, chemotaxis family, sensor kinase CheA